MGPSAYPDGWGAFLGGPYLALLAAGVGVGLGFGLGWTVGYSRGRREGVAEGKAAGVLELQRSARVMGRCPLCGGSGRSGSLPQPVVSDGLAIAKMHGLGNSYVFVDLLDGAGQLPLDWPSLARAVSRSGTGIGSDGLILMERGGSEPVRMRIFNADGSEGEMCGNGIRCVAMYAFQTGRAPRAFGVETRAGLRRVEVLDSPAFGQASVRVDMGRPHDVGPLQARPGESRVLRVGGETVEVWPVSVGNPHVVLFVDSVERAPVREMGPAIERHEAFPERTNVEFCQVVGPGQLRMRVWERGSGETLACGTGACAAAVAAGATGRAGRRVRVELLGGALDVEWDDEGRIWMTGPARLVFRGRLDPGWMEAALKEACG